MITLADINKKKRRLAFLATCLKRKSLGLAEMRAQPSHQMVSPMKGDFQKCNELN
jgi:hypothetical protein